MAEVTCHGELFNTVEPSQLALRDNVRALIPGNEQRLLGKIQVGWGLVREAVLGDMDFSLLRALRDGDNTPDLRTALIISQRAATRSGIRAEVVLRHAGYERKVE